jgi:hypothetical protein
MANPEEEIKAKLAELEASLEEAPQLPASAGGKSTSVTAAHKPAADENIGSDLCLCLGFGLLLLGCFLVMNHVHVGTGFANFFGFHAAGFGLSIIPLLFGVGLLFYDYKNRLGWILTIASLALIFFAVLSQLVMTFPSMSLLGLVIMFLPFAAGGAFIAKGFKKRQQTGD